MKNSAVLVLVLVSGISAFAQSAGEDLPKFELGWNPLSYQWQDGRNQRGAAFSFVVRRSARWGFAADLGVHQNRANDSVSTVSYRFGPRYYFSTRERLTPFVEALAGGARASADSAQIGASVVVLRKPSTGFSFMSGGGLDMEIKPWFSWRIAQVDYTLIRVGGESINGVRIHTGGVIRFGRSQ